MMDMLDDDQLEDIKKMSTARLRAKLFTAGYSDEDVESFDRQICMEKWAELITRGVDDPLPTTPQFTAYDVHCVSKKQDTKLLLITFPNVNRFSKFFHWQTHW